MIAVRKNPSRKQKDPYGKRLVIKRKQYVIYAALDHYIQVS
jgi:hypothetical protein